MLKKIFFAIIYIFAAIGFLSVGVFLSMNFGLLNVRGSIDARNEFFGEVPKTDNTNGCLNVPKDIKTNTICDWSLTAEWKVVSNGLLKDIKIIQDVSLKTGVSPRIIAAAVIPEQIRFFTSNRESFKRYFEPLKILGTMSKFSLGVSGIKQETAFDIEKYANDPTSPFYGGEGIAELIKYEDMSKHDEELFNRLTDTKNHYYSYLYTAIYLKEITAHWEKAGFDVKARPDVLVTLFNLGFGASEPKANPQTAGSAISVGGKTYSFGLLGTLFFNSDVLKDVFPK